MSGIYRKLGLLLIVLLFLGGGISLLVSLGPPGSQRDYKGIVIGFGWGAFFLHHYIKS